MQVSKLLFEHTLLSYKLSTVVIEANFIDLFILTHEKRDNR